MTERALPGDSNPTWVRPGPDWKMLAVVALGGALGSVSRYGVAELSPVSGAVFAWSTLLVNAVGCLIIGAFMVMLGELWTPHRLVRPFFGVGVLGGFTTFSTYIVDAGGLVAGGRVLLAGIYMACTVVLAIACVVAGAKAARAMAGSVRGDAGGVAE